MWSTWDQSIISHWVKRRYSQTRSMDIQRNLVCHLKNKAQRIQTHQLRLIIFQPLDLILRCRRHHQEAWNNLQLKKQEKRFYHSSDLMEKETAASVMPMNP